MELTGKIADAQQPKVLYILTDDHRYDAVRAFNQMLHNRKMSELGYVESPQAARLTQMGTTFINSYCQAQGCTPWRASMHYGRYTFRSGVYEFEYHDNNAKHCRPTLPEQMAKLGYQTLHVGKLGVRIKTVENGKVKPHTIYQTDIKYKTLQLDDLTAWGKSNFTKIDGKKLEKPLNNTDFFVTPDGKIQYNSLQLEAERPEYAGTTEKAFKKYDLIRHYNKKKPNKLDSGMILSGVSSCPAGENRDGFYTSVLTDYLKSENKKYKTENIQMPPSLFLLHRKKDSWKNHLHIMAKLRNKIIDL